MKNILFLIISPLMLSSCLDHLLSSDKKELLEEKKTQETNNQTKEIEEKTFVLESSASINKNNQIEIVEVVTPVQAEKPKYEFTSKRLLSLEELGKYSRQDLIIMRNEIFARHGYIFIKDSEMDTYFKEMNWYDGNRRNVDDFLSNIEKKNINIIQQAETITNGINLKYKISVDNLRVRINPDIDSETIENLPENTIVEYLNEKSEFETAVNIRGRDITSNWYKVKTPTGNTGWIHGCCFEELVN